jgi:hypothetical protein
MTPVLLPLFALLAYIGYVQYERRPWIDIAAHAHAQRGAVNCSHFEVPIGGPDGKGAGARPWRFKDYPSFRAAMDCAVSAAARHLPFIVIVTLPGIDMEASTAVVGDSNGKGIEIVYTTGLEIHADTLLRYRCDSPIRIDIETGHCAPWPPKEVEVERDHLLW